MVQHKGYTVMGFIFRIGLALSAGMAIPAAICVAFMAGGVGLVYLAFAAPAWAFLRLYNLLVARVGRLSGFAKRSFLRVQGLPVPTQRVRTYSRRSGRIKTRAR